MSKAPSIFAMSIVFGGIAGMGMASLLGLDTGAGFAVGFVTIFALLYLTSAFAPQGDLDHVSNQDLTRKRHVLSDIEHRLDVLQAENNTIQEKLRQLEIARNRWEHGGKVRGA